MFVSRKPKSIAIIQARMSSSRLTGKVLMEIDNRPMLVHVVERTRRALTLDEVIVATTTNPEDDPIVELCNERGYVFYRGSEHDVLDRFYQTARAFNGRVVVRITADCPLIDPQVIDRTVLALFSPAENTKELQVGAGYSIPAAQNWVPIWDFTANRLPPPWRRTYPIGLDVEVCTWEALEHAWQEADQPHQREHVMPYLYEQPGRFRVLLVNHELDYGAYRWTVDTQEDLELVRLIYARFPGRNDFTWLDVLALYESDPQLRKINLDVQHKSVYDTDERNKNQSQNC